MTNSLEQRVAQLEKNNRFYRICTAGSLLVVAGLVFMSFNNRHTAPDLIEAKAFHVVDENGKVIVEINKDDGNGQLTTFTPAGKKLVSLFTSDGGGGGINTFDKNGKVIFKVTRTTEGGGYLALFNGGLQEIAELGVTDNESGYFKLNDRNGKKQVWMTYTQNGGGYLSLSKNDLEMVRASASEAGGRISIYNNANSRVAFMGTQDSKDGNVTIWNGTGTRTGGVPN
jgi:hypothetical protein